MKLKVLSFNSRKLHVIIAVMFCILSYQNSYSQQTVSKEVREKLLQIYQKIKNPEISFEKFLAINHHVYEKKVSGATNLNPAGAPQDTYCSKVRSYCANGTFEDGLDQDKYIGAYGTSTSTNLYPDPFNFNPDDSTQLSYGFLSGDLYDGTAHQTIVDTTTGKDPFTGISLVPANGGKKALRLGNAVTGAGVEIIAKTIKVDPNETILNFYYAVVLEDPHHDHEEQPAFSVRAYDCSTGEELPNVCNLGNDSNIVVADALNPFFKTAVDPYDYYSIIVYKDWNKAQINLSKYIGKKVVIVFTNKDCSLTGHFGYTYLDNLFSTKCPVGIDTSYNINLDSLKSNTCGKGGICTKYKLPTIDSSGTITTGSIKISLDIYQNSNLIKTINSSTLKKDSAYCFNIDPATLSLNTSLGGFDYVVTGHFGINGFALGDIIVGNPPTGQKPGTNNDYLINCSPPPNVYYSKAFGDLHKVATWGVNHDGSGTNPTDFGAGKTFVLANRTGNYNLTNNWTVGGLIVDSTVNVLKINGFTLSEAGITGGGKLAGSDSSSLIVTGTTGGDAGALNFTSAGGSLKNFTLNRTGNSASATVGSSLKINGVLTVTNGTLNTGGKITLKSNAISTARVAPVGGNISGSVIVERYIPARRAWRILSAPVKGTQTINAAWQEGAAAASSNPNPGYGTHITGGYKYGSAANGFDVHHGSNSSIKYYKSSNDTWDSVTNTSATAVNANAYLLFVRGNRGIILDGDTTKPNNTVLRVKGPLKIGDQSFQVSASGFTAIPNPYASPINFATITRNNVPNNFYLWDPKTKDTTRKDSVGAYILISYNGSGYDVTPASVSPESQYIQSGQGFLVHSTNGLAGSIVIKESDKSATPARNVFRNANVVKGLRVNLQTINTDKTAFVVDEVFSSYGNKFSDEIDEMDAPKPANIGENLAIVNHGQNLMIDRKALIVASDTIHLKMWNTTQKNYLLEFTPVNLSSDALSATLVDNYLHTVTPVSLSKTSQVFIKDISETTTDRFMVVITSGKPIVSNTTDKKSAFTCYPNPVSGKAINIQFNNQPAGIYNIEMINSMGQAMYTGQMKHAGGTATQVLQLAHKPVNGMYQIRVMTGTLKTTLPIVVN